jgi:hypothetical protein
LLESLGGRHHPQLLSIDANEPDRRDANLFVNARAAIGSRQTVELSDKKLSFTRTLMVEPLFY